MEVTIGELLQEKGLSRYRLSKESQRIKAIWKRVCQKAINEYVQGEKDQVSHLDCLWGEVYGSINACQWGGRITKEQADYLRKKYL